MKKLLLVALAAMLALCMIGCSKSGDGKSSSKKGGDKLNISVFTIQQRQQPPADNKMYKWIEEKFGVTFSWDILVGDKDQKIGVLIASGDLPDLVEIDSTKFYDAGCLIPLDDLIDKYGPNLKKHYAQCWEKMKESDGKVYCLPNYGVYDGADQGTFYNQNAFWIQKDVLKEFGYPEVKTIEEYFDLLDRYAKKYPTIDGMPTIPFSIITYDWEAFNLWNPPIFLAGSPNEGEYIVERDGKGGYKLVFGAAGEYGYRWYKIANEMYNRGLIDPASFTDNSDQYWAKLAQGRVLGMFAQGWQFQGDKVENVLKTNDMYNRTYAPLAITLDPSIKPHYRDRSIPNIRRGYGITTKCGMDKAIKIIQFMDEQLKEENQKVLQWGFEGEDWQKDSQGRPSRTEEQRKQQEDNNWILHNRATLWCEEAPKMEGSFSDGYACNMNNQPWEFQASAKPEDLELWNAYGVASYAALVDPDPPMNAGWYPLWQEKVPPDGTEEGVIYAKMETTFRKHLPKVIMCKPSEFEANWKAFTDEINSIGMDKYEKNWLQVKLDERVKLYGGFPDD